MDLSSCQLETEHTLPTVSGTAHPDGHILMATERGRIGDCPTCLVPRPTGAHPLRDGNASDVRPTLSLGPQRQYRFRLHDAMTHEVCRMVVV
ncbi:unnamed protein product [Protopolystoma xenopodis]|uniref:Uncharacterized protein n=1 Tax=Protopolystoma xenopodis TaxID=117903 RepID=A0A3S5AYI1_9PLAT|nr:unnamed protein product [Protopolystoma xenopodis]